MPGTITLHTTGGLKVASNTAGVKVVVGPPPDNPPPPPPVKKEK